MLLPISWLKTYLPKPPPTQKLVEVLMIHGLDVEDVMVGNTFEHVVVGEIVAIKPHPNADKLRLAYVIIEPNGQSLEIVCGAPNIEVGQKVPVALIGAKLPNGITIESRAIRGITSNGMICAEDELGLGKSHAGIMVLDAALKVGTPFGQVVEAEEVIDLAIPANRADLMGMRGLAWEIGAMLDQQVKFPTVKLKAGKDSAEKSITLEIVDSKLCSVLTARVIRGVTMKPTPALIVNRLRASGMRSVNIIVDITNYIMLEYGQPLHAYDAAKVNGQTLIVRKAKNGEQLKTLDGKTRTLIPEMLVIADAERVIGLAGVMGGEETEVTDGTTDIILEAAIFDPVSIRKTSRQLGLMSEASKRFEKGLWSSLPEQASAAAAAMIVELCGGTIEEGMARVGQEKKEITTISLDPKYISERLGMTITPAKSKTILSTLGFNVKGTAKEWKVSVPEWRIDVTLPEDIVDEVGRMVGYEKLPKSMPNGESTNKELPSMIRFKEEVKNILIDMGLTEVISHAFYGEVNAQMIKGKHFEVANPLDETQHKLRKSILPEIVEVLERQADTGRDAMIFELGNVFNPELPGSIEKQQESKLVLGVAQKGESIIESLVVALQQRLKTTVQPHTSTPLPIVRGRRIDVREFDVKALMTGSKIVFGPWDPKQHVAKNVQYKEPSKYPAVTRDIAFWWSKDEKVIVETIQELGINVLQEFEIKDRFSKDGKTSYALSFIYQSHDRTLTKAEVDKLEQKIKDALVKLGGTIR